MATVTMWDSKEIIDTAHELYFGWPWYIKGHGHNPLTWIFRKRWQMHGWTPGNTYM